MNNLIMRKVNTISLRHALDLTLKEFQVSRVSITQASGISESSLSRFLAGSTDLGTERLQKVLNGLPIEAQSFYFALLNPGGRDGKGQSTHKETITLLQKHLIACTQDEYMDILREVIQSRQKIVARQP